MAELNFYLDKNHLKTKKLESYLTKRKPGIVILQMTTYDGLEKDLKESESVGDFVDNYKLIFPTRDIVDCVFTVLEYVKTGNAVFRAIGLSEIEIKDNVVGLIKNPLFKIDGLCSFIIGSAHEDFVKQVLESLFSKKFKVTYYKSSS